MIVENPGLKIRILREIKGYTQENMASELGVSAKAYQKIERGETQLTISRLNQISIALNLSVLEILSFDESKIFDKKNNDSEKVSSFTNNFIPSDSKLLDSKDEFIKSLQSEIEFLRKVVSKNLEL